MTAFHRVTCITAFVILCHLLTLDFTIKPLPSQGLWTLSFTQLVDVLPQIVKGFLILTIILLLLFSAITLKLQATAFIVAYLIIDMGIRVSHATLALTEQTSFYICIIETRIDPIYKIEFFNTTLELYMDCIIQALPNRPEFIEAFKENLKILKTDALLI